MGNIYPQIKYKGPSLHNRSILLRIYNILCALTTHIEGWIKAEIVFSTVPPKR